MSKMRVLGAVLALAVAGGHSLTHAQPADDLASLVDQLGPDVWLELGMLGFIRSIIVSATEFAPMCEGAPPGEWPDPTAVLKWTPESVASLHAQIASCEKDYSMLYGYLRSKLPNQRPILERLEASMNAEIAANNEAFPDDLAQDKRGISYGCAMHLSITQLCHDASLERTQ